MTARVERYSAGAAEWDAFAESQRGFTHFHRYGWRRVMERVFRHECLYLATRDERDALTGVLPLVRVRSIVFGHYLVSMPFLNYGGPLGDDDSIRTLAAEAIRIADRTGAKLLEFRSRVPLDIGLPVSHRKVTVVRQLPATPGELFAQFDAKLRSQIRRPQKAGVTVSFGAGEVDSFFAVFSHHMRDLGTPTQPRALFREIAAVFPNDAWFACAYLDGRPVAAGSGFRFGDEFEMTWASSLRANNRESPNMLLYHACMERAIGDGVKRFNFGRCTPGQGTHRFKLQWGGADEPLWWYGHAASASVTTPSPASAAYRWGPRIWSRLPHRVATSIGPSIVRYLP
jgi:serine/alanine adding enzyme